MIIIKKITEIIRAAARSLEPVSRRIMSFGAAAAGVCYAAACVILLFRRYLFPDYGTACYWSLECAQLAKELLGASFVPALLFEIVLIAIGIKSAEK